jgi:hypothetical protein
MYQLVLLDEAKQEWLEASLYYESKQKGLGVRFTKAVEEHINIIAKNPKHFKKVKKDYRQLLVKLFPFLLIYKIDEAKKRIVIISVFHSKRNPKTKYKKE